MGKHQKKHHRQLAVLASQGHHTALPFLGPPTWFFKAMARGSSGDSGRGLVISCRTSMSLLKVILPTTLFNGP